ncbi:hypothetical protein N2152v2_009676 [Parachlorella kessleri]
MSFQARAKPVITPHLPQEVVQRIFSLRLFAGDGDLVLSLKDRALEDLFLYGESLVLLDSLATLYLFPGLTRLCLKCAERDGVLDLAILEPLTALRQLECSRWQHVNLWGTTQLLRQLTSLELSSCGSAAVDAELPSLRELLMHTADAVWLTGEHLRLPQLTQLGLEHIGVVAVQWAAVPQLEALSTVDCPILNTDTLAPLGHLTSLCVGPDWQTDSSFKTANEVLQAAPPSVQRLRIKSFSERWLPPKLLQRLSQLTSLTCDRLAIIPQLGALPRLQHLEIESHSVAALTLEHAEWLSGMTSLRRLCSIGHLEMKGGAGLRRVQALRKLLPVDCTLEQPMLE